MKKRIVEVPRERKKAKASQKFVTALAIVSIAGFGAIVGESIFGFNVDEYVEALLMFVIGAGLLFDSDFRVLKSLRSGLSSENLNHLTTAIVGFIAIVAGIFSIPQIRIEHSLFVSTRGIISIIAIIVIIVQTWFTKVRE